METFHALYSGRGDADQATNARLEGRAETAKENIAENRGSNNDCRNSNNDSNGNGGRIDAFVVPQPSRYVPDWAAFSSGGKKGNGSSKHWSVRKGGSGEV